MDSNLTIKTSETMEKALTKLEASGKRICFVTAENGKLVGVVTDSEIRRALITGQSTVCQVGEIMKIDPLVATLDTPRNNIKAELENIGLPAIPILDHDGVLVDAIFASFNYEKIIKDTTVFILAGGFGKRLGVLTADTPKPMLKINDVPILHHIINKFYQQGFREYVISTYYLSEQIIDYFGDGSKYDIDINYTEEDTPLGTGGSLSLIKQRSYIKSNLIVVNGDVLNDVNMRSLLSDFYQSGAIAAICAKNYSMTVPYGVCEVDDMELTDLIEKPSYNFLINAGIYCLRKNALSFLEENKKIDMPDFLLHLKQIGEQVICIETDSNWLDVGRPNDFELASSIIMDLK